MSIDYYYISEKENIYLIKGKMKFFIYSLSIILAFLIYSCSASTDERYEEKEKKEVVKEEAKEKTEKDFDIEPYRSKISIEKNKSASIPTDIDIWYEFENIPDSLTLDKIIIGTTDGYRVQVLSTDNLEEANNIRSELIFRTNHKHVYVEFEPPFYRVKVGDFTNIDDAKSLTFKLSQMGYVEARVVPETVNVYQ